MAIKIYTKTGDGGETSLLGGTRVPKDSPRIDAYGTVDELNSALGVVLAANPPSEIGEMLEKIQDELFAVGSGLATPSTTTEKKVIHSVDGDSVARLEKAIDALDERLPKLRSFILPGGAPTAASLHFARTICRRAERAVVRLSHTEQIDPAIVAYLNRLSDLLFVMARFVNHGSGHGEILWPRK